ncbi:MAG TPA: UDP-N-acetylmuramoyl-L-alanine--D-glutamate ligase [Smithella sp.]|nr:UDP-N-acetylmuramoyl-L-alanine--D-glutamate ligase [Smithella sp.]
MDLRGKTIVVIGMGKTGMAAAQFLGGRGAHVVATDEKPIDQWPADFKRITGEKWLEIGDHEPSVVAGADLVIPSPGVPPRNALLEEALRRNIPVVSEIELAYRFLDKPIIAVTGTNGKTTTTTLLGEIMNAAGKRTWVGGNIGNPLIAFTQSPQTADYIVAEISSFQLQWIETFRPFVAVLLNITRDHTDYHGSFAEYVSVKSRIFANQTPKDYSVVSAEEGKRKEITDAIKSRMIRFSSGDVLPEGIFVQGEDIIFKMPGAETERYPLSMINLPGAHNRENVMAAVAAARLCGCPKDNIISAVRAFRGLPHRIEFVAEKNSVKFYDDSKGTNVGSVQRALETFTQPIVLLLGGRDKEGDFESLKPLLAGKAKKVVLFGEARNRIESLIGREVPTMKEAKMKDAVLRAYREAQPGDVVLLSPGCASFDEFANYKERGNCFKEIVRNL